MMKIVFLVFLLSTLPITAFGKDCGAYGHVFSAVLDGTPTSAGSNADVQVGRTLCDSNRARSAIDRIEEALSYWSKQGPTQIAHWYEGVTRAGNDWGQSDHKWAYDNAKAGNWEKIAHKAVYSLLNKYWGIHSTAY